MFCSGNSSKGTYLALRYFLDIAYKGTHYHGWQLQQNAHSVQAELEGALQKVFRRKIDTLASGRTDTGVHAEQQLVHLDLEEEFTEQHLFRLNSALPKDVVAKDFYPVIDKAHARFDAVSRSYEYRIARQRTPFLLDLAYMYDRPLDVVSMNEAAALLLNYTDYESFSKVHTDVNNFHCTMYFAQWREKNGILIFEIEANRFLRGMVRALVGSMMMVGTGKSTVHDFQKMILAKDRRAAGPAAPAEGLFLTRVKYPDSIYLEE